MLIRYNKILVLVLVFYALWFFTNALFAQGIAFKRITVENGLSNNKVNCVLEDKAGFIWFGTEDGLNRFDGYDIKIYRNKPDEKNSISSNDIWTIFEDEDGFLWIGTKEGELNRYNPKLDKFEYWKVESDNTNENIITSIYVDKRKSIWVGTYKNGIYKFDLAKKKFTNWHYNPDNPNSISNNYITSIAEDYNRNIWISTYNGINIFNPEKSDSYFTRYYQNKIDINSITNNLTWNIVPSKTNSDIFWICTASGLSYYDLKKSEFAQVVIPFEKQLQFGNSISSIIEEDTGTEKIYWLGSYAGLIRLDVNNNSIQRFLSSEDNPFSLSSDQINEMIKDRSGVIWIATEDGVSYFTRKESRFNNYLSANSNSLFFSKLKKTDIKSICNNENGIILVGSPKGLLVYDAKNQKEKYFPDINNWTLTQADENNIWIGTYGQGLKKLDLKTNTVKQIEIKSNIILLSFYRYVKSILQDKDGIVWIGFWGSGLVRYDPVKSEFTTWINDVNDKYSLSYNDVWSIIEDKFANIWIGTNGGGLNLYEKSSGKFIRLSSNPENKNSLSSNTIYTLYESKKSRASVDHNTNIIWIGTSNGLDKLTFNNSDLLADDEKLNVNINSYTTEHGLPDNSVKSIIEDDNGNLWIGTSNGLSQFDPETERFINYSSADGLIGSNFNSSCALKSNNGLILLGSSKGLNFFNPKEIRQSEYHPPVILTDFLLFNKSVSVGKNSPLKENILSTKEILLSHYQNIFSFKFTALDFNSPQSIRYAYKMVGLDDDWIYAGSRRYAAYTSLEPGIYYFMVKATNSDGVWNENYASVKVVINQPWWKTGWAYLLYFMIIGLGLFGIRRFENNRTELRNELKMREFEAKKLKEVEKVKTRFFANLSHEFRTPLMLIKGPAEQLLNDKNSNRLQQYQIIHRNSEKLQNLIDQLLELSQLEVSSIDLKARKENLVSIVKGIFYSFSEFAERKKIKLSFNTVKDEILTWIDRDKLEKILNNLLSNAFKFTGENGMIEIEIVNTTIDYINYTTVSIKDSGIGIPSDKVDKIFDRFFQVDDSSKRAYSGSGIGLSLVKELVDLHKWKIFVQSKEGTGTQFILQIPLDENYLSDSQKLSSLKEPVIEENPEIVSSALINNSKENKSEQESISKKDKSETKKSTLLIVEDSEDVRIYLQDILKLDFDLLNAENGEKGLSEALEKLPDLIISDVMMPIMDGIEFCKQVKSDWKTSHIPVILLTAKASAESKIEGLETGADDYVTKPFSSKELLIRIKNLLAQRTLLKEKYRKDVNFVPENITPNKADQEFLVNATSIVQKFMDNSNFDSDIFASEMFLSRSQLHRKIHSITGQSTGEFIRTIRLKKAAGLILEKKLSITQIALEVGFNSPSHFTKAFKQFFGCLPSEFLNKSNS